MSILVGSGRVHDLSIARKDAKEFANFACVMADLAYKGCVIHRDRFNLAISKSIL